MSKVNDKHIAIARVYSHAMLDLADARGVAEDLRQELAWVAERMAADEDFGRFMSSPLIDAGDRAASIDKMFRGKLSDLAVDSLQVVQAKGRLALLPEIVEAYRLELRQRQNRVDVYVRTAVPIDESLRAKIRQAIGTFTSKDPDLHETVDPSLIGGIVLRVGDQKVDASVLNEIHKVRNLLEERSAREILRGRSVAANIAEDNVVEGNGAEA